MKAKVELKHEEEKKTLWVIISGEINDENIHDFRKTVDAKIETENLDKVIFDLACTSFADEVGVGFLIGRYKKCSKNGVKMTISQPSYSVNRILNLSGVYSLIPKENAYKVVLGTNRELKM